MKQRALNSVYLYIIPTSSVQRWRIQTSKEMKPINSYSFTFTNIKAHQITQLPGCLYVKGKPFKWKWNFQYHRQKENLIISFFKCVDVQQCHWHNKNTYLCENKWHFMCADSKHESLRWKFNKQAFFICSMQRDRTENYYRCCFIIY